MPIQQNINYEIFNLSPQFIKDYKIDISDFDRIQILNKLKLKDQK